MTNEEMVQIWEVAQSGDSIQKVLYKMLGEMSGEL